MSASLAPGISPVTLDEIIGLDRYEAMRSDVQQRIIALKRNRRLAVGSDVTLVFENHATVFFQTMEMLRAERISNIDLIREELEVYNALLPKPGELSATLLINITEQDQIEPRLLKMIGIDEHVFLSVDGAESIRAEFEPGRSREDRISAVQYIHFPLTPAAREQFCNLAVPARVIIDHTGYSASAAVEGGLRASLAEDLVGIG